MTPRLETAQSKCKLSKGTNETNEAWTDQISRGAARFNAPLRNSHTNAAEGLTTACYNYLRCGTEASCTWAPNSCCLFGCRIEPICVETVTTQFQFQINNLQLNWTPMPPCERCTDVDSPHRVLVVSRGTVRASLLPGLLKYRALPSPMMPHPPPICPPLRLCQRGLNFPSKPSVSSVGPATDGTQLSCSTIQ